MVNFFVSAWRNGEMFKKALILLALIVVPGTASTAVSARLDASPETEPHFVKLPEIMVPVIDGERINGRLLFEIVIDAVDAPAAERLALAIPRLRAASITAGIEFSRLHVSGLTTVDAQLLAHDMTVALRAEEAGISRVLIVRVGAAAG